LCFASPDFFTFFSVLAEINWEEHPQNDVFCVKWDDKHWLSQSVSQETE